MDMAFAQATFRVSQQEYIYAVTSKHITSQRASCDTQLDQSDLPG